MPLHAIKTSKSCKTMPDFSIIDEGSSVTLFKNRYILTADGDNCIECEQCIPVCAYEEMK